MTIESENQIQYPYTSYEEQRYERLVDTIDEYLCDDEEGVNRAEVLRSDLLKALAGLEKWPKKQLEWISDFRSYLSK